LLVVLGLWPGLNFNWEIPLEPAKGRRMIAIQRVSSIDRSELTVRGPFAGVLWQRFLTRPNPLPNRGWRILDQPLASVRARSWEADRWRVEIPWSPSAPSSVLALLLLDLLFAVITVGVTWSQKPPTKASHRYQAAG
jgi:hypothetical protein